MSYSRRQLEALGEPFGDSATRKEAGRIVYGGGGGGGGTSTQVSELPEWARGYAKDILAKGSALTDINQNPMPKYGGDRYAGLSDLQKTAMSTVASPESYGKTVSGYMSPYMQNVVDIQKREAARQSSMLGNQQQAAATQAGAFGGYREAIQRGERERNLMQQMNDIQAQGSQAAFSNAQSTLAQNLASQQQLGALQQQDIQRPLDIAYQDFLNEQNYPYKQLGFMSDLLRGTPTGNQQVMYQGAGSTLGQLAGLGMGMYGLSRMAEGGVTDSYASGGTIEALRSLSDEQLQQSYSAALDRQDVETANAAETEIARRNQMRSASPSYQAAEDASMEYGLGAAFDQLPEESKAHLMAGGGIIAFAEPTEENNYSLVSDPMGTGASEIASAPTDARAPGFIEQLVQSAKKTVGYEEPEWKKDLQSEKRAKERANDEARLAERKKKEEREKSILAEAKAKMEEEEKRPAPASSKAVNTAAVRQGKAVAASLGVPESKFMDDVEAFRKAYSSGNKEVKDQLDAYVSEAKSRAQEIKDQSLNEALTRYGFGWAQAASRPGARFVGSAAAAAPILGEAMSESRKLEQAAKDKYQSLMLENAKFNLALNKNDMATALSAAQNMRADRRDQQRLEIQRQQLNNEALRANKPGSALEFAYNTMRADPANRNRSDSEIMSAAARTALAGFRTDAATNAKLADALQKIDKEYGLLKFLPPDSDQAKRMMQMRNQAIQQARQQYGGADEVSGQNAVQTMKFDSKGNLIQ